MSNEGEPLKSVHTTSFPELLKSLGSLAITTYQANRLILARNEEGVLNTHFRSFAKPMGLAIDQGRMALGTGYEVWELYNNPEVAAKLAPPGKHDGCWLPRSRHITGDIDIHEMAFDANQELWLVNTRFSCLCTLRSDCSFVPQWRPNFVSELTPEDRCHLNGLAMRDGRPRYVTTLGQADTEQGWRENKARGGTLIDVESNEMILQGLSMPHSPRWYQDRLWLLESGDGSLGIVDLDRGRYEKLIELPGFTRGLCFAGSLAFVGLSQVRESAIFSGIPIAEREEERVCGAYVVDLQSLKVIAFLQFTDAVQEIFAVELLRGQHFPDVVDDDEILSASYVVPQQSLSEVPRELRH